MGLYKNTRTGDVVTVPPALEAKYDASHIWEHQPHPNDPQELRGAALDAALEEAGLPKTGSADEKRARYAEHLSAQ